MTARKVRKAKGRLVANRLILVVLVLLALAGVYGVAGGLVHPVALTNAKQAGQVGRLPVISQQVACPAPGSGGVTGGNVALATAPARAGSGQVDLTALDATAGSRGPGTVNFVPPPGQLAVKTVAAAPVVPKKQATMLSNAGGLVPTSVARGGLVLTATGTSAQGLDVEQLGPDGQPSARCQAPGSDFWFVGPNTPKLHTELYLVNADAKPADANLSVQTDSGPQLGAADNGITVPPHGMVVQNLDKLLHNAKDIALHVTTSTGRVVAAVRQTSSSAKPGIWLPAAASPATTQVLPGSPATSGFCELFITVPGGASARVKVTAVTSHGSYQPTGTSGISLLGHLTAGLQIPSLSGVAGAIKISSSVPVAAVLEVSGGPSGAPGAFLAASQPIVEQGVVAASPVGRAGTTELVLADPGPRAATVNVAEAIPGAQLTGQQGQVVKIAAMHATLVKLALPKHSKKASVMAIIVTPLAGSGPVYAARLAVAGGSVQTVLPVNSSPTVIVLPPVRASLVTVLGSLPRRSAAGPRPAPGLSSGGKTPAPAGRPSPRQSSPG